MLLKFLKNDKKIQKYYKNFLNVLLDFRDWLQNYYLIENRPSDTNVRPIWICRHNFVTHLSLKVKKLSIRFHARKYFFTKKKRLLFLNNKSSFDAWQNDWQKFENVFSFNQYRSNRVRTKVKSVYVHKNKSLLHPSDKYTR